ncbi:E3 ubiquitin-protein ligase RNF38-like [Ylistrum balloti]|uniref:E3 ubiquitin-protein ligase RNF38-like n=1 Tax=Ylistrum balloti TaxID=509963 RepID=UPI002905CCDF|nr:E3 ubiquitin-protein ligase RNF38-like [Ylistrum balloti]XP_060078691.1 E3 ubiquitin-protein ligase RNF38-like [Ylistrum balloti]
MATDAEIARKLQLEEFQQGDSTDPDAQLAWQLQQSEVSEVDELDSGSLRLDQLSPEPVSQSSDTIGYDHPVLDVLSPDCGRVEIEFEQASAQSVPHVNMYSVQDDERFAFQLDEQLKLSQEQEDAVLAQKLFEEEENHHSLSRVTRPPTLPRREPPQRNRPPRHFLLNPVHGRHQLFDPTFSPSESDIPLNIRGHHHHHLPRPDLQRSTFGVMMRNNIFPRNMLPPEDVDLNDYEALWELAEQIGDVKGNGVTQEVIDDLPSHAFKKDMHGATSQKTDHECRICLSTFSEGEAVKTLPCLHMYHQSCIDNWLKRKGDCPICREHVKRES